MSGEATHTLTINEMPNHSGHFTIGGSYKAYMKESVLTTYGSIGRGWTAYSSNEVVPYSVLTGGSAAHNNMPPYLVVYMWKRTA